PAGQTPKSISISFHKITFLVLRGLSANSLSDRQTAREPERTTHALAYAIWGENLIVVWLI
ncbi:hypothetical protein, partial [Yersinia aleksiciae]|uniref:hypothetical protein n=1 Tax=Yersinia aleksiciae TaxID=263819 RepID=UPI001C10EFD1